METSRSMDCDAYFCNSIKYMLHSSSDTERFQSSVIRNSVSICRKSRDEMPNGESGQGIPRRLAKATLMRGTSSRNLLAVQRATK